VPKAANILHRYGALGSFKVIKTGTNRKSIYDVLSVVMDDFKISKLDRFRFDFLKKI